MDECMCLAERDRIGRYVESFRQLAGFFRHLPAAQEDLSEEDIRNIFQTAKEKVCENCGRRKICWGLENEKTWRLAYKVLIAVEDGKENLTDGERDFYRYCVKGRGFREAVEGGFVRARLNMMWSNRIMENRAAVAQQLGETARIIEEIACTVYEAEAAQGDLEKKIKFNLWFRRVNVKELGILRNIAGHPELILTMCARGSSVSVKEVSDVISEIYGKPLVPVRDSRITVSKEICTIHFVEETRYYMLTGVARAICSGEPSSGDNFAVVNSNHGQVALAISDGMGKGIRANRESQAVIELLEQFFDAGFSADTAINMINTSMILQQGIYQYSTLDLCEVNLYNGQCRISKIGAAKTYIRRKNGIDVVSMPGPPAGVFQQMKVEHEERKLENGDMIFMISDGVLDALPGKDGEELLIYFIEELTTENPAQSAQILLNQVLEFCQEGIPDDMTILTGGFWRK